MSKVDIVGRGGRVVSVHPRVADALQQRGGYLRRDMVAQPPQAAPSRQAQQPADPEAAAKRAAEVKAQRAAKAAVKKAEKAAAVTKKAKKAAASSGAAETSADPKKDASA